TSTVRWSRRSAPSRRRSPTVRSCGRRPGRRAATTHFGSSSSGRQGTRGSTSTRSSCSDSGAPPAHRRDPTVHSLAMTDAAHPAMLGAGTWVILPTYDEAENLPGIAAAILEALPAATLLVVDDSSPDGTGELADRLAAEEPRIRVRHRAGK